MAPKIIREHPNAVRTGFIGAVLLGLAAVLALHTSRQPAPHQAPTITMVMIQPPKPPPPPPLPQPRMVQQQKVTIPQVKPLIPNQPPKPSPPRPAAPSAVPLGTSIHNNGPADAFNLSGTPGGDGFLGGGGGGGGSRWGYYAEQVQSQIQSALQRNKATRNASAGLQVQIWADAGGNVTRVVLVKASGDPAIDEAIRSQVLSHMQLPQPPSDMPMPIVLSLTGQSTL